MRYLQVALATVLYIGTVDSVDSGIVSAEITASGNEIHWLQIPAVLFPCELKETDMFYFVYAGDVIEIRCGEPPIGPDALYVPRPEHKPNTRTL